MRFAPFALVLVALVAVAPAARADIFDLRAPVRVGFGYSRLYRARVLSVSFEDEMGLLRLADGTLLELVFGMDGVRGPTVGGARHGYLSVDAGTAISQRLGPGGPLLVLGATFGPLFEGNEDFAPHGVGVAARAELFPFYLDVGECARCTRGGFASFVLSGLSGWVLARQDWLGDAAAPTYAAGFGIDLARNFLFPVLDAVLGGVCSPPSRHVFQ
jgi:hypothetical protein